MCLSRGGDRQEDRPGKGGRGLKGPVKEVRMGSQQRSVSKSEGLILYFGRNFLAATQKKG